MLGRQGTQPVSHRSRGAEPILCSSIFSSEGLSQSTTCVDVLAGFSSHFEQVLQRCLYISEESIFEKLPCNIES